MTKFKFFHLKNDMLAANFLANLIGVLLNSVFLIGAEGPMPEHIWQNPIADMIDSTFTPFAFMFVCVMTFRYERPVRSFLNAKFKNKSIPENIAQQARQRLLNEPFVLMVLSFSMWLLAAIIYPTMFWMLDVESFWIKRSFFMSLSTGLITVTVAFFLLEHVLQKRLAPLFFPEGGLYTIPRTLRIRIRTRLAALLFACNLIPLFTIIFIMQRIAASQSDPMLALNAPRSSIYTNTIVFLISGALLTLLVSRNLTQPFAEIIQTLRGIRNGEFDKKVQVTSNDEIGYTGDVINEMTVGLKERERMRQSLDLAKEVQQHLMPDSDPRVHGLDVAGRSIYCEETGGDYYDYLPIGNGQQGKIGVVVGDVSDHGIPSALLMTTARAFLRQRSSGSGNLNQIVTDVNRQLSRDVKESGRFMTLFISEINRQNETIQWVNAGHEPALIFDPHHREFYELTGGGLPLGVSDKAAFQKFQRKIAAGHIVLIGTDGIWETQNQLGEMFGKNRFKEVVHENADAPAKEILSAVMGAIDDFSQAQARSDDVTLVVVKIKSR